MSKSLQEQIAEDEQKLKDLGISGLTANDEGDENGRSQSNETKRGKRNTSAFDETEDGDEGATRERGRNGKRSPRRGRSDVGGDDGASEETSQSDGKTPQEDSETSRSSSRRSPRSVGAPRSDARRSDRGTAQDGELLDENEDEDNDDPVANARLRRENRELKAKLRRDAEQEGIAARTEQQRPAEVKKVDAAQDPEPQDKNSAAWDKWKIRDLERRLAPVESRTVEETRQREIDSVVESAKQEFVPLAKAEVQANPEFGPALKHAFDRIATQLHYDKPNLTPEQLVKETERKLLTQAGVFARKFNNDGKLAMKELYDWAIEYHGYRPGQARRAAPRQQVEDEDDFIDEQPRLQTRKPNLRIINNNRRRSASGLQGGGQSGSMRPSLEAAANMSLGEMANLDTDVWDQLENMGR